MTTATATKQKKPRDRRKVSYIEKNLRALENYLIQHPGTSKDTLKELGYITDGLAGCIKLTTLMANGRALEIDGLYYPHTKEYLRIKYPRAATRPEPVAIAPIVEQDKEPESMDETTAAIDKVAAALPNIPEAPTLNPIDWQSYGVEPRTTQEKKCLETIAHFESLGKPFRYCDVQKHAKLADNYLSANSQMREVANAAIIRCGGLPPKTMPKTARTNLTKERKRQAKPKTPRAAKQMQQESTVQVPNISGITTAYGIICEPIPSAPFTPPKPKPSMVDSLIVKWKKRLKAVETELNEVEATRKALIREFETTCEILKDLEAEE